jgi:hypothetical protein
VASCRLAATALVIQSGSGRDDTDKTLEVIGVASLSTSGATSGTDIVGAASLTEAGGNVVTEEIFELVGW